MERVGAECSVETLTRTCPCPPDALAAGLHSGLWVCGLSALAAVPMAFLVIRRTVRARAVVIPRLPEVATPAVAE